MDIKKRYFVDLFAGCGGLSLGLENAGFYPILINELSDEARETYLVNRKGNNFKHLEECPINDPENPWVWKNVLDLHKYLEDHSHDFSRKVRTVHGIDLDLGELDLIIGGPPCQGYSGIGHRRSYAVDRRQIPSNHVYQHMISIIKILRPKMFLFENVKGLMSARWYQDDEREHKGNIWLNIRSDFKEVLGGEYEMGWHLVHSYEYGVPQNRPRILLAGIRKDLSWKPKTEDLDEDRLLIKDDNFRAGGLLPQPSGTPPTMQELLGDLVDDNYENGGATQTYPKPARTAIARILRTARNGDKPAGKGQPVTEHVYSHHSDAIVNKFRHMIDTGGEIREEDKTKKFSQRLLPREWGGSLPTITATSIPDDYVHYQQPRILTVREWARLQMFPDWYLFKGRRTTGGIRRAGNPREKVFDREVPRYTQIGNAVPVRLAEAVGRHFMAILNECDQEQLMTKKRE